MFAWTQTISQRVFRNRRRPQLGDAKDFSGFGSSVTYVVGTAATQISVKSPVNPITGSGDPSSAVLAIPESSLRPGMQFGTFQLIRRLGQGAQGDVWKAKRQEPCLEIVALKVLNPALAKLPKRLAQFRREAERGARLAGPSLLQVFEFGEIEGSPYMAMPFVEGTTLQQVIKGRQAHLWGEAVDHVHQLIAMDDETYMRTAVRIMSKAARALSLVHANRVAHRDVKPANILLDGNRACGVYLCDLGLGRDLEVATPEQMRDGAGTPMYMAPERLLKAPADEILCDLYSMGVTLFETFTLDRPFETPGELPLACLPAFLARAQPKKPRNLKPDLPADLEAIILKAMSRNPRDRHRSAQELASELDRFLVRRSFRARRVAAEGAKASSAGPHEPLIPHPPAARTGTG